MPSQRQFALGFCPKLHKFRVPIPDLVELAELAYLWSFLFDHNSFAIPTIETAAIWSSSFSQNPGLYGEINNKMAIQRASL
ncbi:hypothetical protein U1Q18_018051 [Sarracenia purpurea var. burkii]